MQILFIEEWVLQVSGERRDYSINNIGKLGHVLKYLNEIDSYFTV